MNVIIILQTTEIKFIMVERAYFLTINVLIMEIGFKMDVGVNISRGIFKKVHIRLKLRIVFGDFF